MKVPGSFIIDLNTEKVQTKDLKQKSKRKIIAWKEDLRKAKRQKQKFRSG